MLCLWLYYAEAQMSQDEANAQTDNPAGQSLISPSTGAPQSDTDGPAKIDLPSMPALNSAKPLWKTPPFWQAVFSGCLVLNAVVTLVFLSRQLENATTSTAIARDALEGVQRAFVVAGEPTSYNDHEIIRWTNDGATRTRNARYRLNAKLTDKALPMGYPFPDEPPVKIKKMLLGPKASDMSVSEPVVTLRDFRAIKEGHKHLYVWGWMTYNNVFRETPLHITMACFEVQVTGEPLLQGKQGVTMFTPINKCDKHICADEECYGEIYGDSLIWPNGAR